MGHYIKKLKYMVTKITLKKKNIYIAALQRKKDKYTVTLYVFQSPLIHTVFANRQYSRITAIGVTY